MEQNLVGVKMIALGSKREQKLEGIAMTGAAGTREKFGSPNLGGNTRFFFIKDQDLVGPGMIALEDISVTEVISKQKQPPVGPRSS